MPSSVPPNAASSSGSAASHAAGDAGGGFALGAPAILSGEWVGDRYRILRVLGQGGFGRTYLAKDSQRFDETCVLKEFAPQFYAVNRSNTGFDLEKAQHLFEREAGVLYRLDHPQIPKFRELLQQEIKGWPYLFLVQDYVEGRTLQEWLRDYQGRGQTLGELEVVQLLRQSLPVLEYLHGQGVIHRDISPDNLIQRQGDGLPVLIDFGAVKQAAATVLSAFSSGSAPPGSNSPESSSEPHPLFQGTRLGKLGYSPPEQMQYGTSFPHSDLYALGATALTLLSGLEPQLLMDPHTLEWTWMDSLSLQPGFAEFLQQMMALRPSDRYPSATVALQALDRLVPPMTKVAAEGADADFAKNFSIPVEPAASWAKTIVDGEGDRAVASPGLAITPSQAATVALGQRQNTYPAQPPSRRGLKLRLFLLGVLGLLGGLALGLDQLPFDIQISRRDPAQSSRDLSLLEVPEREPEDAGVAAVELQLPEEEKEEEAIVLPEPSPPPVTTATVPPLYSIAIDAAGNGYRRETLQPGQRSTSTVPLQQGQRLRVSLDSSNLAALSLAVYAPGKDALDASDPSEGGLILLAPGDRKSSWEGILPRTGSYELVITSQASGSLEYGLTLVVEAGP